MIGFGYIFLGIFVLSVLGLDLIKKFHQNDYKIRFDRIEIFSYNRSLMKRCEGRTFKYNRTTPAFNLTFEVNVDVIDELYVIVQAYKFVSNEYRPMSIRMQLDSCDCFKNNVAGIKNTLKCGNYSGCPLLKGKTYHLCNFFPDESQFPPFLPNGDFMVELEHIFQNAHFVTYKGYFTIYRPILVPKK